MTYSTLKIVKSDEIYLQVVLLSNSDRLKNRNQVYSQKRIAVANKAKLIN